MPKIREYGEPKLEFQGQASSFISNPDIGENSRQISQFADTAVDFGRALNKRRAQQETSDINANGAELAADFTVEIDEATRDGSIDTQKYMESVDKRLNDLGNDIQTSSGRRAYERTASRLRGQAFKRASRGQAAVAGATAQNNLITELSSYSMSTVNDPGEFKTNYQAMIDSIDDQVSVGAIKATDAEKLKLKVGKDLAQSAVRGWADLSPDLGEKRLKSGEYSGLLDEDDIARMQSYINSTRRAKEADVRRVEATEKRAKKAAQDAFIENNLKGLVEGTLDTDKIMKNRVLDGRQKMQLINLVEKNAKDGGGISNPRVKNRITKQILSGEITDVQQFVDDVGQGINVKDLGELNSLLAKTPEGEAMIDGERRLFDVLQKTIGQKDMSNPWGGTDASSEYNISRAMFDYQQKKAQMIKDGKNPLDLVNPNSKDYFGLEAKGYKLTPQQTLQKQAEIVAGQTAVKKDAAKKYINVIRVEDGKEFQMPEENWPRADKNKFRRK